MSWEPGHAKLFTFVGPRHVHCQRGTPLANLCLTQLQALGIEREKYADSTGTVAEILA